VGIREGLNKKKGLSVGLAAAFVLIAVVALIQQFRPVKKANLAQAFYSDDDGKTWFTDSAFLIAPFDHNGKTAVIAEVYTYDNGSKQFCAYVAKYNDQTKHRLDQAIAQAQAQGQSPGSLGIWNDRSLSANMLVKLPGPDNPWISISDPQSVQVCSVHSPDGSAIDQLFVY
jgi:hypothetical protein